jgi:hypothetical protein
MCEMLLLEDDLEEARRYWKLKEEAQDRTLWRTHKGMVRSDISKPALVFFSLQEYTQQSPLSKF